MNKILLASSLMAIASVTIATPAHALINIIGQEIGGNVQFSYSGSLDITGLSSTGNTGITSVVRGIDNRLFFNTGSVTIYDSAISRRSFGGGSFTSPNSSSGNILGITDSILLLPSTYVSNANIGGSITFNSATFASLGVTPGVYNYNLSNGLDSINLSIGSVTPVPFEFSPALGLGVLGGLVAAKKLSGKFLKK
jgi:hypothetical protein